MYFPLYIAKRYIRTSSTNNAINIISKIASGGIIIGAMALFVVLCVFSGLKDFSLSFSNSFDPDLKIFPKKGKIISISGKELAALKKIQGIQFYSKVIEEKGLFIYKNKEYVAEIKGVDNQFTQVNAVAKAVNDEQWLVPHTPQVIMGKGIGEKLSLGLFDLNNALEVYVPRPGEDVFDNPETAFNKSILIPIGFYSFNDELDAKYVFTDLKLAQDLLGYNSYQVSGVELKLSSLANEDEVVKQLYSIFNHSVVIKNRMQLNDSLHKMLNTENTVIYLIFTLVIIMTLFTLAGAIIMLILDKKLNLKTLFNLGVSISQIQMVFLLQGLLITVIGGVIGVLLGSVIVYLQIVFNFIMITDTLPYPVKLEWINVFVVFITIFLLGFIASFIASSRVNRRLLMAS